MSAVTPDIDRSTLGLHTLEQYEPLVGAAVTNRINKKAERVCAQHVVHVSSNILWRRRRRNSDPLTLVMNAMGIETGWRMIQGMPEFFTCTKKLHNTLQGDKVPLSDTEKGIYEQVIFENALRLHLDECDAVIVHDPQPLPLVRHFTKREMPWLWQCHIDLSSPHPEVWNYLREFVELYNTAVFSLPEYDQNLRIDQLFITPAINPFSAKNSELSDEQIEECLAHYRIPTDRPLVVQISRFDRWKDPLGVIEAFRKAREQVDCPRSARQSCHG
jgi:trehalose synthase